MIHNDRPTEAELLTAAARGNLSRHKESGAWVYTMNHRRIGKPAVLPLMRSGLLELERLGPPFVIAQRIEITVKGREALRKALPDLLVPGARR